MSPVVQPRFPLQRVSTSVHAGYDNDRLIPDYVEEAVRESLEQDAACVAVDSRKAVRILGHSVKSFTNSRQELER